MGIQGEIAVKEERLRRLMEVEGLSAIVLSTQANFAWFTCGGDNHVNTATDGGVASAVVTMDGKYIVTKNIEAARIMDEEVNGQGFELRSAPWHTDAMTDEIKALTSGGKAASDDAICGLPNISGKIEELRYSLTPDEMDRFRWLGRESEKVMDDVCKSLQPGITENEVAGRLAEGLYAVGITPIVLLIAADERIEKYRHPINTSRKIERCVESVICARKWGLIASLTRIVHFGKLPGELRRKHDAVVRVDAALNLSTEYNRQIADVLKAGIEEYEAVGFPDEWKLHHQGGPAGYGARDFVATPDEKRKVFPNQVFAWNPSITGTKSEDTILITEQGIEWLTASKDWPMIDVEYNGQSVKREDILVI